MSIAKSREGGLQKLRRPCLRGWSHDSPRLFSCDRTGVVRVSGDQEGPSTAGGMVRA